MLHILDVCRKSINVKTQKTSEEKTNLTLAETAPLVLTEIGTFPESSYTELFPGR